MNDREQRSLDLMIESIYKPDSKLRGCAYNQSCFPELMGWRQLVIDTLKHYHETNEVPPQVSTTKEKEISLLSSDSNVF
tara:strand:- start:1085 stop:1321 length:237 start_codon:yes stop_codon:yes gene_type:complete